MVSTQIAGRLAAMSKKTHASRHLAGDLKRYVTPFRADGEQAFRLKSHRTDENGDLDKAAAKDIINANRKRLANVQEKLYASGHWSVLLIFQGMDAAGKDSAIEHVFSGVNPQGCEVASFKSPSTLELNHDFLWRNSLRLPERGRIGIFNRSYYEECLIVRVHPDVLAKEKIPPQLVTRNIWRERFEDINAYERYLSRNGTLILKFFLNVSKEEQRRRFLDRLEEPGKRWKFSMNDVAERQLWDKYQAAYQDVIAHTSTAVAPWYVVPADHKWFARVVIGSTIVSALEQLDLRYPKVSAEELKEFSKVRVALEQEGNGRAGTTVKKIAQKAVTTTFAETVARKAAKRASKPAVKPGRKA
jgi:PPK2 family polyphosphate:nucleotide phosphotransferase